MEEQTRAAPSADLPLTGIRVLDCSRVLAGPFATMLLADLGADVIKLEPPQGDDTRAWGPPFWGELGERRSAYFASVNRNKRSIVVNLKTEQGRHVFDLLAERSDLLVHNFRPRTLRRLQLEPERLETAHPHLIVAGIGGFPGDSTSRNRAAYDLLAQAVSGLMSVTGDPKGAPIRVGVAVLDLLTGLEVAVGALAALIGRRADRTHHRVEVSLVEVGVTSLVNVLANYLASGHDPTRYGNAHPNIAPYQAFEARDGYVALAVGNDGQFACLLETLGLADDADRFATNADRVRSRDELATWLGAAILQWPRDELVAALVAKDVPAGPVLSVAEAVGAMQSAHDGRWLQEAGSQLVAPNPVLVDGQRTTVNREPPSLGEHTDEILREAGLDDAAISQLRDQNVVGRASDLSPVADEA